MAHPHTRVDTAVDTADPNLCHRCRVRPVAHPDDAKVAATRRMEELAEDPNPAVAHIAAVSVAYARDAVAYDRLAGDPQYSNLVETMRKRAVVSRETAVELAIVAGDARSVSQP